MSVDQAPAVSERGRIEAESLRLLRDGYSPSQVRDRTGITVERLRELAAEQPGRPARPAPSAAGTCGHVTDLPTRLLVEHPGNVRTNLGDLTELQQSILTQGILQPLLVTRGDRGQYIVIGGHRRLAAAVAVDLPRVPVMLRGQLTGTKAIEAMLVENLQRADLHPLDEAAAYQRLIDEGRSRAQIAAAVGKDPGHLSQRLALLNLTPAEQTALRRKEITVQDGYRTGRARSRNAMPAGQHRPKPKRVPHFTKTHPLSTAAAARCEHETTLKLGVACGPCWESTVRDDERQRLGRTGAA